MRWFRMECFGAYLEEGFPPCTYMELDDDWYQVRVLELFGDADGHLDHVNFADMQEEAGVMLAEGCFLEIDRDPNHVVLRPVPRVEFETVWNQRKRLRTACSRLHAAAAHR